MKILLPNVSLPKRRLLPAQPKRRCCAFSLVEVVLAMGVVSFCLVALAGIIPVGVNTLKAAMQQTVERQVVQQLTSQIQLEPYSQITNYANQTFYYDDAGVFLTNAPTPAPADAHYSVTTTLNPPVYPGSANSPATVYLTNSMYAVQLQVVSAPSVNAAVKNTNDYVIIIPNSGN
jgi:uncharacterized protein (TIGR02598 family)